MTKAAILANLPNLDPSTYEVTATGSSTARALAERFADVVNVKDHGAVGDGVTDDTAAIQAAIDYAETLVSGTFKGATIFFPSGKYLITDSLVVTKGNITFRGVGRRGSKIVANSPSFNVLNFDGAGSSLTGNGFIEMGIDAVGNATSGSLLRLDDCIEFYCAHSEFTGWVNGIELVGANRCVFTDIKLSQQNRSSGTGDAGVLIQGDATAGTPSGNHFTDIEFIGQIASGEPDYNEAFYIKGSDGLYLQNIHIDNCQRGLNISPDDSTGNQTIASILVSNIYFDGETTLAHVEFLGTASTAYRNIHFSNCQFRESNEHSIRFNATSTVKYVTITGGTIRDNGKSGIRTESTTQENVIVNGVIFSGNNTTDGASDADCWLRGQNFSIIGCQFIGGGAAGSGLRFLSNCDNSIAVGCDFTDSTAGTKFADAGSGNKYSGFNGFVIKNKGSDSIANGATSKVVAHGLDVTPSAEDISIIGKENPTNDVGTIWVSSIGATNFTMNVENDPGASGWDFGWKVDVSG